MERQRGKVSFATESLKVKGHGLWTLNVRVSKTEIWSLGLPPLCLCVCLYEKVSAGPLSFSSPLSEDLYLDHLKLEESWWYWNFCWENANLNNIFQSFGPIISRRNRMIREKLLGYLIHMKLERPACMPLCSLMTLTFRGGGARSSDLCKGAWL